MRPLLLLCDDDRTALARLGATLRDAGFDAVTCDNGDDAILLARQHRPALALLQLDLPGKSGLDVAAYLRDRVTTPFVLMSALRDDALRQRALAFGALDWLALPLDAAHAVAVVRDALDRLAHAREAARASEAPPAETGLPGDEVAVAIGILMERFALDRAQASTRLDRLASQAGRTRDDVAAELVSRLDQSYRAATLTPPGDRPA